MTATAFSGNQNQALLDQARFSVTEIEKLYSKRLELNSLLSRSIVSFQANRAEPIFRWFKYREGFSRQLIDYLLDRVPVTVDGLFLDPFAGTGAAPFIAANKGMDSIAIELLPVGCLLMETRQHLIQANRQELISTVAAALKEKPWNNVQPTWTFPHLTITKGAFPGDTEISLSKFKTWVHSLESNDQTLLNFALFSILEEISFTRKDGQYLRWDSRATRTRASGTFDKGAISTFDDAIARKLGQIFDDLQSPKPVDLLADKTVQKQGAVSILQGTVFEKIASVADKSVSHVITSPPYCNRYDYTRTYALELAFLGIDELEVRRLRQTLLTCTVENKPKDFSSINSNELKLGQAAFANQKCLQAVLEFLESEKSVGNLNNDGIVRMVRGYFSDTAIHLAQISQKIKRGGVYVMVNDNVRYNGLDVPVDCILSNIAESVGFQCEKIWVLPIGKGNSSQQMKKHGRSETRKCVYVWRRL